MTVSPTYHVYALFDPRDPIHVRYVGYTKNYPARAEQHLFEVTKFNVVKTHKQRWIKKLVDEGVRYGYRLLNTFATPEEAKNFEIDAILVYRESCNFVLTNGTQGGDGVVGPTEESRRRTSESLKKALTGRTRSPQECLAISLGHKRRWANYTQERRQAISTKFSVTVQSRSPERKEQISAALRAGWEKRKVKFPHGMTDEQRIRRSEGLRRSWEKRRTKCIS